MGKQNFKSFKDLICWQKARILVKEIYKSTKGSEYLSFADQLERAGLSVANNIAEGYSRRTNKDKSRFFNYTLGSCSEIENMSYLMEDLEFCSLHQIQIIRSNAIEIHKMVNSLDQYFTKTKTNKKP